MEKEIMKTSNDYLKILIEVLGEEWKQKLNDYLKDEDIELDNKSRNCIEDFLMVCMEEIKDNESSNLQKVEKKINNDLLYKNIRGYLDSLLLPFYAFAPLRTLEVKDYNRAAEVIGQIFQQTILRFNPNIFQDFDKYGFDNGDVFADFLNAQASICSFAVRKNMCYGAIEDFIYSQTRLSRKLCKYMTSLIDNNFDALKINYIIEKITLLEGYN